MTSDRVNKISSLIPEVRKAFGVDSIALKPVALKGRVLSTPRTVVGSKVDNFVSEFYRPADKVTEWGMFLICKPNAINDELEKKLIKFTGTLRSIAKTRGLIFADRPKMIVIPNLKTKNHLVNIFGNLKKANTKFVFFGIPDLGIVLDGNYMSPTVLYNLIKNQGDRIHGFMTQCFKACYIDVSILFSLTKFYLLLFYHKQKQKQPSGYFQNLLLKVNAKLNGQNKVIELSLLKKLPFKTGKTMLYVLLYCLPSFFQFFLYETKIPFSLNL